MYVVDYSGVGASCSGGGVEHSNKLTANLRRGEIRQNRGGCSAVVTKIPTGRCFRCDSIKTFLATSENIFCISSSGSVR